MFRQKNEAAGAREPSPEEGRMNFQLLLLLIPLSQTTPPSSRHSIAPLFPLLLLSGSNLRTHLQHRDRGLTEEVSQFSSLQLHLNTQQELRRDEHVSLPSSARRQGKLKLLLEQE
ncbi:hypothetical protein AOLI_G00142270 [Acnodon oligacanthus]